MAAIGAGSLLLLKTRADDTVLKEGGGVLQVEYGVGFWLALVLFLLGLGMNVYVLSQRGGEITNPEEPTSSGRGTGWLRAKCPICGKEYEHSPGAKPRTCGDVACIRELVKRG